jgi:peptidyl-tRNA hydrolase
VLQKPLATDRATILDAVDRAVAVLEQIVAGDFEAAMNELHASLDGNPT